jgi:hypothetical protein
LLFAGANGTGCEVRGFEYEAFGYTRKQKPEDRKSLQLRCRQNKPLTRPLATLSPWRGDVNTLLLGEKVPQRGGWGGSPNSLQAKHPNRSPGWWENFFDFDTDFDFDFNWSFLRCAQWGKGRI